MLYSLLSEVHVSHCKCTYIQPTEFSYICNTVSLNYIHSCNPCWEKEFNSFYVRGNRLSLRIKLRDLPDTHGTSHPGKLEILVSLIWHDCRLDLAEEACPAGLHPSGFFCGIHQPKIFFEIPDVSAACCCLHQWCNLWLVISAREPWVPSRS